MYANWKIDTILGILKQAGAVALEESTRLDPELKDDLSVVTAADKKIEAFFASHFDRPGCGSYMIGEETIGSKSEEEIFAALRSGCCYVVDPIDGTAPYTAGLPVWGCSIGLMKNGVLSEGAIYQPVADVAYITCRGSVWIAKNLQSDCPEVLPFEAPERKWNLLSPVAVSTKAAKKWHLDFSNQVFAWGCCVADYAALFSGRVLGACHSAKLWDVAGGMPILKNLGYCACYRDGSMFDLNIAGSGDFLLEPGERRWRHRRTVVLAPDAAIAEHIWNRISGDEEEIR